MLFIFDIDQTIVDMTDDFDNINLTNRVFDNTHTRFLSPHELLVTTSSDSLMDNGI